MRPGSLASVLAAAVVSACAVPEVAPQPWKHLGDTSIGLGSKWAWYEADFTLEGRSGALANAGSDTDTSDFDPKAALHVALQRRITDSLALGLRLEYRKVDPDSIELFGADYDAREIETFHLALTSRYWFPTFGATERWRPFAGLDVVYVPDVDFDADITYAPGVAEQVKVEGDQLWTADASLGLAYLWSHNVTFELFLAYEATIDEAEDTFFLTIPSSVTDATMDANGYLLYFGVHYHF